MRFGDDLYMLVRYLLPVGRWPNAELHDIFIGDSARWLHDHPYPFLSVTLRGGGTETIRAAGRGTVRRRMPRIRYYRSTDLHRIDSVDLGGMRTLVITGPRRRMWGFARQDADRAWKWRPSLPWSPDIGMDNEQVARDMGFSVRKGDTYYSALCRQAAAEGISMELEGGGE